MAECTANDPKTRDVDVRRAAAMNTERRFTTEALVGGVQGVEERCGRPDEEKDADERRSCSRGATGWQRLSGMP